MRTFISFHEALGTVLSAASALSVEEIPLKDALGRTLAGATISAGPVPPFASSAMDGFAVRAADFESESTDLENIGHIAAGAVSTIKVVPGTCIEIMTGAPTPEGCDAVAPVEWVTSREGERVVFKKGPTPGQHVRPAGEDVAKGDQVFSGGERITPAIIGMLATLGVDPVPVIRQPIVAILSTGDEVVLPAAQPRPGQIRNSNGPSLREQAIMAGAKCDNWVHAPDDPVLIRAAIDEAKGVDLLVISGGVSVGDHDHVKQGLRDAGAVFDFWKVRQRPGKPLAFGRLGNTLLLGLPGNPVSSAMCFEVYGRALIERLSGRAPTGNPTLKAVLGKEIKKVDGLHFFTRAIAEVDEEGVLRVKDTGPQRSNLYGSVVQANCILHLPEAGGYVREGTLVTIEMLPWSKLYASAP